MEIIKKENGTIITLMNKEIDLYINNYILQNEHGLLYYLQDEFDFDYEKDDELEFLLQDFGEFYTIKKEKIKEKIIYNIKNNFNYLDRV